jgi:hypothetical protein
MKRIISAALATLALTVGLAAGMTSAASASPAHQAAASPRACELWTGYIGPPPNASVAWNVNCYSHELRVKIHCENPVSHFAVDEYGGWVKAVGLHSGATCPANENHLVAAYGQYRNSDTSPITTVRYF